jgi:hypothetical protein
MQMKAILKERLTMEFSFLSVEKKLNDSHSLNFTGFYTPNSRGKNSPNSAEVTELTSETYNSWGYQDGRKETLGKTIEEPLMLNHYFKSMITAILIPV